MKRRHPDSLQAQIEVADKAIAALQRHRRDTVNELRESRAHLAMINGLRDGGFTYAEIGGFMGMTAQAVEGWLVGRKRTRGR